MTDYERINEKEGWIALYEEKMLVLEKALKYHDAEEGVTWYTLQYWLYVLYGDREYHLENDEEDEE